MASLSRRFSVFALLAIVLPAAIVAVLGYVSLQQWRRSSELLFREQARALAAMAAEKVSLVLRRSEDEFLSRLESGLGGGPPEPRAIDALLESTPLIQRLAIFDRRGRRLYPVTWNADDAAILGGAPPDVQAALWEGDGRREFVVGDHVVVVTVLRPRQGAPVLLTWSRNIDVLRRDVLDGTLGALEAPTIAAVFDHRARRVYSRLSVDDAELVTAIPFQDALPGWSVALYQPPGAGPRHAIRRQLMLFTAAFGVLIAMIVVGAVATWQLTRRETEMAQLKSDFVANVSHDLKTPLSVIRMFGETLEMERVTSDAQRREYYRVITRESERLSRLIDNVLDFSRIEGGRRTYQMARAPVEPLVHQTIDAFAYPLREQGFKLEVHVDPDLPDVSMDSAAVEQALANLVDNAIKYSADRRSIRVEARSSEGGVAITVADEGIGIPRDEQARIFEKFYRVGRSETQGRRGSGVGLALVRHVAQAHGGRITVDSEPGAGSRFTLWLPG